MAQNCIYLDPDAFAASHLKFTFYCTEFNIEYHETNGGLNTFSVNRNSYDSISPPQKIKVRYYPRTREVLKIVTFTDGATNQGIEYILGCHQPTNAPEDQQGCNQYLYCA